MSGIVGTPMVAPVGNTEENPMGAFKKGNGGSKPKAPKRSRSLMYVQQVGYLSGRFSNKRDLEKHLNTHFSDTEWAYILHDKDMEKGVRVEDHIHIAFYFPNPRTPARIAEMMGEPAENKGSSIEIFSGRWGKNNMFAYLVHATDRAKEEGKHRYSESEVTANFDYMGFMERVKDTAETNKLDIDDIQARIISGDLILKDFFQDGKLGHANVASLFYTNNKHKIDRAIESRYRVQMSNKGGVDLEIIYIQGEAGSGKTTLAKEYAERKYGDYFMTGSSNDAVQDYMGESVAIFDDARPSDFDASDWLKLLDPYNNKSTVTSRYYNKFLAVECIILTTTTPFHEFFVYAKNKAGVDEPISQFMRRFSMVLSVRPEEDDLGNSYAVGQIYKIKKLDQPQRLYFGNDNKGILYDYGTEELKGKEVRVLIPERKDDDVIDDFVSYF